MFPPIDSISDSDLARKAGRVRDGGLGFWTPSTALPSVERLSRYCRIEAVPPIAVKTMKLIQTSGCFRCSGQKRESTKRPHLFRFLVNPKHLRIKLFSARSGVSTTIRRRCEERRALYHTQLRVPLAKNASRKSGPHPRFPLPCLPLSSYCLLFCLARSCSPSSAIFAITCSEISL